jgi:hypothetical protein
MPPFPNHSTTSTIIQASPTPIPRPTTFRAFGKENGQLELPNRRSHSNPTNPTHMYPPQMFYDTSFNPLFNHAYAARSFPFGESQSNYNDNRGSSGYPSSFQGDFRHVTTSARSQQTQGQSSDSGPNSMTGAANGFSM